MCSFSFPRRIRQWIIIMLEYLLNISTRFYRFYAEQKLLCDFRFIGRINQNIQTVCLCLWNSMKVNRDITAVLLIIMAHSVLFSILGLPLFGEKILPQAAASCFQLNMLYFGVLYDNIEKKSGKVWKSMFFYLFWSAFFKSKNLNGVPKL